MKNIFFVLSCLLLLNSTPAWAVVEESPIVVVRVYESFGRARIVVERGSQKPEILEFDSGSSLRESASAAKSYYWVFTKLYQEGYILQGTVPAANASGIENTTLVFVKNPKL